MPRKMHLLKWQWRQKELVSWLKTRPDVTFDGRAEGAYRGKRLVQSVLRGYTLGFPDFFIYRTTKDLAIYFRPMAKRDKRIAALLRAQGTIVISAHGLSKLSILRCVKKFLTKK